MSARQDFWSRRRAAVAEEEAADVRAIEARAEEAELADIEAKSDAEILEELNLPDPDTLQAGDDVRAFMAKAVPERLRRRALRQLWKLNPVLANVDGLVDYGEDFTDSATVLENLQTTYQVGKGMLAHVEEMARQAEAEAEAAEQDATPEDVEEKPVELAAPEEPVPEPALSLSEPEPDEADLEVAESPRPRRMKFDFGAPYQAEPTNTGTV